MASRRLPLIPALFLLLSLTCITTLTVTHACKESERTALLKFVRNSTGSDLISGFGEHRFDSWVGEDCCSWKGVGCDNVTAHVVKLDLRAPIYGDAIFGEVNPCLLELKYLTYLDLSGNFFRYSRFPEFIGSMSQLQYLNLSYTFLSGKLPQNLGNLTKLVTLDLNGGLSWLSTETDSLEWAFKLKNLQYLDLTRVDMSQALDALNVIHHLPFLSVLNLAGCQLGNSHLSLTRNSTISSTTLQHLDLSHNFIGTIPSFLQNLTAIRFLDLGGNNYRDFPFPVPSWLGRKVELRYLDLGYNNLIDPLIPNLLQNLSLLTYLDLSGNQLSLPILSGLSNKKELEFLSLRENLFTGSFPHCVQNATSLRSLDLSYNQFNSSIPSWLANKTHLEYLFLGNNLFDHVDRGVMNIIGGLCDLTILDLSHNQLQEDILELNADFFKCSQYDLRYLYMQNNSLSGQLPTTQFMLSLQALDLSHNNFEVIPSSFGELFSLEYVYLSYNRLSVLHQTHLANLSSLKSLDISANTLALDISPDWLPPFQLESVNMLPCNINSQFPKWILSQQLISELDLSNTGIFGSLPSDFGNSMSSLSSLRLANNSINGSIPKSVCKLGALRFLDLNQNKLSGEIPNCWENSQILGLELSSNRLSGHIPESLMKSGSVQLLSLGDNFLEGELPITLNNCTGLMVLDVGKNKLHGEVPSWNGANFTALQILILRENRFSGVIPSQLCSLHKLQIIDLASNDLVGRIPPCFGHFEGMALAETSIAPPPPFPSAMAPPPPPPPPFASAMEPDEWSATEVTKGREMEYTTVLHLLVNMDLSCNNLVGAIPVQITNLSLLAFLNLSHNHLKGSIPKEIGEMKSLESIDLSFNNLTGSIPESISSLDSLGYLGLSFNNLQGRIPTGRHLQTFQDPSTYAGNPGLCGDPLPKKCFGDDTVHPPTSAVIEDEEEGENKHEKMWFYLVIVLGFASGFWGVIGVLLVKQRSRHAFFQLAEDIADWLYCCALRKRMLSMSPNEQSIGMVESSKSEQETSKQHKRVFTWFGNVPTSTGLHYVVISITTYKAHFDL